MVFEKTLTDVVKGIRSSRRDTTLYISQCISEIKTELQSNDPFTKANAIQKLTFLQMLGYNMSWAAFACVEVMSYPRFAHKRIGFLGGCQGLAERSDTDVILLSTNLIKKELRSAIHAVNSNSSSTSGSSRQVLYEAGLAINFCANVATADLAREILSDVSALTSHPHPYLRKKAVLCLFKLFVKYPQGLRLTFDKVRSCLTDADPSVVSCAVNVIAELSDKQNPKNYLLMAPQFFHLLTTSSNNWMLIKVVKLLGSLVPEEPRLARKLLDPLLSIVKNTQAKSLLYEAVHTVTLALPYVRRADGSLPALVPEAVECCVATLRSFVQDPDQNLKYLGLVGFASLLRSHPQVLSHKASTDEKDLVLACLSDEDVTIRVRALDVLTMSTLATKPRILVELVSQLLHHVEMAQGTRYQDDLVGTILFLCRRDRYAYLQECFGWYVGVLIRLARGMPKASLLSLGLASAEGGNGSGSGSTVRMEMGRGGLGSVGGPSATASLDPSTTTDNTNSTSSTQTSSFPTTTTSSSSSVSGLASTSLSTSSSSPIPGRKHAHVVRDQLLDVTMRVLPVRVYSVRAMMAVLLETHGHYAERKKRVVVVEEVLPAAAWIVGEYASLLPSATATLPSTSNSNLSPHEEIALPTLDTKRHTGWHHAMIATLLSPTLSCAPSIGDFFQGGGVGGGSSRGPSSLPFGTQAVYVMAALKIFAAACAAAAAGAANAEEDVVVAEEELEACVWVLRKCLPFFMESPDAEVQERAFSGFQLLRGLGLLPSLEKEVGSGATMIPSLDAEEAGTSTLSKDHENDSDKEEDDSSDDDDDEEESDESQPPKPEHKGMTTSMSGGDASTAASGDLLHLDGFASPPRPATSTQAQLLSLQEGPQAVEPPPSPMSALFAPTTNVQNPTRTPQSQNNKNNNTADLAQKCRAAASTLTTLFLPEPMKPVSYKAQRRLAPPSTVDLQSPLDVQWFASFLVGPDNPIGLVGSTTGGSKKKKKRKYGGVVVSMEEVCFTQQKRVVVSSVGGGGNNSKGSGGEGGGLGPLADQLQGGVGGGGTTSQPPDLFGGTADVGATQRYHAENQHFYLGGGPTSMSSSGQEEHPPLQQPMSHAQPMAVPSSSSGEQPKQQQGQQQNRFGVIQLLDDDADEEEVVQPASPGKKKKKKKKKKDKSEEKAKNSSVLGDADLAIFQTTSTPSPPAAGGGSYTVYHSDDDEEDSSHLPSVGTSSRHKKPSSSRKEFERLAQVDLMTPLGEDEVIPERQHRQVPPRPAASATVIPTATTPPEVASPSGKKKKKGKKDKGEDGTKKDKKKKKKKAIADSAPAGAATTSNDLLDLGAFDPVTTNTAGGDDTGGGVAMASDPAPAPTPNLLATGGGDRANAISSAFDALSNDLLVPLSSASNEAPMEAAAPAAGGGPAAGLDLVDLTGTTMAENPTLVQDGGGSNGSKRPWLKGTITAASDAGGLVSVDWSQLSLQYKVYVSKGKASLILKVVNRGSMAFNDVSVSFEGFQGNQFTLGNLIGGSGSSVEMTSKAGPFSYSSKNGGESSQDVKGTIQTSLAGTGTTSTTTFKLVLPCAMLLKPVKGLTPEEVTQELSTGNWSSHSGKVGLAAPQTDLTSIVAVLCGFLRAEVVGEVVGSGSTVAATLASQSKRGTQVRSLVKVKQSSVKIDVKCSNGSEKLGRALVSDVKKIVLG